jgi:hypothetical protein
MGNVTSCPRALVPLDLEAITVSLMGGRVMPLALAPEMVAVGQNEVVLALFHGWTPGECTDPSTGPERTSMAKGRNRRHPPSEGPPADLRLKDGVAQAAQMVASPEWSSPKASHRARTV